MVILGVFVLGLARVRGFARFCVTYRYIFVRAGCVFVGFRCCVCMCCVCLGFFLRSCLSLYRVSVEGACVCVPVRYDGMCARVYVCV